MPPKKKKPVSLPFSTIRTIGRKAQSVITLARQAKQESRLRKAIEADLPQDEDGIIMHVSLRSVVHATLAILAIFIAKDILWELRHKLLLLILAAFVATLVDPGVQALERYRVPRGLAILVHYLVALFLILFLLFTLIPTIADQLQQIGSSFRTTVVPLLEDPDVQIPFLSAQSNAQITSFAKTALDNLSIETFLSNIQQTGQNLSNVATESVRFAANAAGSLLLFIVNFIIVLVLAFFIQLDKERIINWLQGFLPLRYRSYARRKSEAIHVKIGQWMRGELLLMFSIFSITFVLLLAIGLGDFALTLALLAGFCELIPAVGPFFAAIPAILIAGVQKGALWVPIVAGLYYLIQWSENNLLVPLIMKRAVGLSPIAILFAMMVGVSFPDTIHPILGIMLSVPATTVLAIFLNDWRESKRN